MNLAFDLDRMMSVFEAYNHAIWPMQVLAYLAGLVALYSAFKPTHFSANVASGVLSFFWLWTGVVFCFLYWGPIYPAGYAFGVLFVVQGILFLINAIRSSISFHAGRSLHSAIGILFIAYAMIGYLIVGNFLGHVYPRSLVFGVAPCPTTCFTLGLIMLTDKKVPKHILAIPALVALAGIVPARYGIYEDIGLILAGLVCIPLLLRKDKRASDLMPQPH